MAQAAGAGALWACAPDLARGVGYGPAQLGAVHLIGLAFLTVAIVASLMQLVPVLLRTPLMGVAAGVATGALVATGSWSLALGLWSGRDAVVAAGGTCLVLGGSAVVAALVAALIRAGRARTLGAPGVGLALSTAWLAAVLALGALMAVNRAHPFLDVDRMRLIAAHGAVAVVGWIGGTIVAVALRLAPMFALSHGYRRGTGVAAMGLWHASVPPLAVGLGTGSRPLAEAGGVVLLAACATASAFALDVARHRRRRVEAPLIHLVLGIVAMAAAVGIMLVPPAGDVHRAAIPAAVLALVGLGAGVTSGHLMKVVPMVVWTGRFATLAGTPGAPTLADLVPRRLVALEPPVFAAGLALVAGGTAGGSAGVARAGAALLVLAAAAVAAACSVCLARARRPGDRGRATDTSVHHATQGAS